MRKVTQSLLDHRFMRIEGHKYPHGGGDGQSFQSFMPGVIRDRAGILDINPLSGRLLGVACCSSELSFSGLGMEWQSFASSAVSSLTT